MSPRPDNLAAANIPIPGAGTADFSRKLEARFAVAQRLFDRFDVADVLRDAEATQQIAAVIDVLKELQAESKPTLYVFNKADRLENEQVCARMLHEREGIFISASAGTHLEELKQRIEAFFRESQLELHLCIPFAEGRLVTELHRLGTVKAAEYIEQGTLLYVLLPASEAEAFMKYKIEE